MKYYVCFQNCIEDYFSEDAPSLEFSTFDAAIRFLTSITINSPIYSPDPAGEVRWFFARCTPEGTITNPDPEIDQIDLYQIINIIPGQDYMIEPYRDDPSAIISMQRSYTLDVFGNTHDIRLSDIEYIDKNESFHE